MRRNILSFCLAMAFLFLMAYGTGSTKGAESSNATIKGVWTIENMEVGIGENRRTTVPQAFMLFIMEKHYSAIRDFSPEPRQDWKGQSGTQSAASMGSFMADAGTYEYDGTNLVVHHQVAMIPNLMHGGSMTFGCKLEGDNTLVLTPQYEKMVVPGMNMAPPKDGKVGYGDMAVRYVFKRLE
jgi:hypothetical protein